jgi:hypothetical protein
MNDLLDMAVRVLREETSALAPVCADGRAAVGHFSKLWG